MGIPVIALTTVEWKKSCRPLILLSLSVGLILVLPLASSRAEAQETPALANSTQATARVIMLPPHVVFEQLSSKPHVGDDLNKAMSVPGSGKPHVDDSGSVPFESVLTNAANSELNARGYTLVTPESLQDPNAIDLLKQLQPLTSRLARGVINDEGQQILNKLGTLPRDYLIFVQFLKVREGPGGSWNAWSGSITSSMSSMLLQTALISTRTGKVTWKNEVLERKVFRADDPNFAKYVNSSYEALLK